jgi:uncharacterized protein with FMN-binding domain
MKIHFKKILVSFLVILGFVFYAFYQRNISTRQDFIDTSQANSSTSGSITEPDPGQTNNQSSSNPPLRNEDEDDYEDDEEEGYTNQSTQSSNGNTTTNAPTTSDTTTTNNSQTGIYKNGQYDGNTADAYYGYVQVRAIVQGGKLVDVQFLRYPNDRSYSVEVNNYAMPILKSEAIKAQSASVNIVTGATNTSRAFITSLSSALSQAQV